ncbi:unnamed protein product [Closterium sp. Yama58-4]|nr:unnamed protein product [Closterium sp. Yama58-4]
MQSLWADPTCGDGSCDRPFQFPAFGRFGCEADCGMFPNRTSVVVRFSSHLDTQQAIDESSWNLCMVNPVSLCWYEAFQPFPRGEAETSVALDIPDGDWVVLLNAPAGGIRGTVHVAPPGTRRLSVVGAASTIELASWGSCALDDGAVAANQTEPSGGATVAPSDICRDVSERVVALCATAALFRFHHPHSYARRPSSTAPGPHDTTSQPTAATVPCPAAPAVGLPGASASYAAAALAAAHPQEAQWSEATPASAPPSPAAPMPAGSPTPAATTAEGTAAATGPSEPSLWSLLGATDRQRLTVLQVAVSRALFTMAKDRCLAGRAPGASRKHAQGGPGSVRWNMVACFCTILGGPSETLDECRLTDAAGKPVVDIPDMYVYLRSTHVRGGRVISSQHMRRFVQTMAAALRSVTLISDAAAARLNTLMHSFDDAIVTSDAVGCSQGAHGMWEWCWVHVCMDVYLCVREMRCTLMHSFNDAIVTSDAVGCSQGAHGMWTWWFVRAHVRVSVDVWEYVQGACMCRCGAWLQWRAGVKHNTTIHVGDKVTWVWDDDLPHSLKVAAMGEEEDPLFLGFGGHRLVVSRKLACTPMNVGQWDISEEPQPCVLKMDDEPPNSFSYSKVFDEPITIHYEDGTLSVDDSSSSSASATSAVSLLTVLPAPTGAELADLGNATDSSTLSGTARVTTTNTTTPSTSSSASSSSSLPSSATAAAYECSPGCRLHRLANGVCDAACNTPVCAFDGGDCACVDPLFGPGICACPPGHTRRDDGFCAFCQSTSYLTIPALPSSHTTLPSSVPALPLWPACCLSTVVGTNLNFPFSLQRYGPNYTESNFAFAAERGVAVNRFVSRRNRLLHLAGWCSNGTSTEPFGVNPHFLPTSAIYDSAASANMSQLDNSTFGVKLRFNPQGLPYGFIYPVDSLTTLPLVFDINLDYEAAMRRLHYLVDGSYINNGTRSVDVSFITFNGETLTFVLTTVTCTLNAGGSMAVTIKSQPAAMAMHDASADNMARLVLEVVYLVGLLWNVCGELQEMADRAAVDGSVLGYFGLVWNWVDMLSLALQLTALIISSEAMLTVASSLLIHPTHTPYFSHSPHARARVCGCVGEGRVVLWRYVESFDMQPRCNIYYTLLEMPRYSQVESHAPSSSLPPPLWHVCVQGGAVEARGRIRHAATMQHLLYATGDAALLSSRLTRPFLLPTTPVVACVCAGWCCGGTWNHLTCSRATTYTTRCSRCRATLESTKMPLPPPYHPRRGICVCRVVLWRYVDAFDMQPRYDIYYTLLEMPRYWAVPNPPTGFISATQAFAELRNIINLRAVYFSLQGIK